MALNTKTHPDKAQQRNTAISAERLTIERLLRRLPVGETITAREIVRRTQIQPKRVSTILYSMRQDNLAINKGTTGTGQWCGTQRNKGTPAKPRAATRDSQGFITYPDDPICNGNQPNGSLAYWQAFQARLMAPARQPASK